MSFGYSIGSPERPSETIPPSIVSEGIANLGIINGFFVFTTINTRTISLSEPD